MFIPMTKAKPVSISLTGELEQLVMERIEQEKMSRSEYLRKCIREEVERAKMRRTLLLNPSLAF